MKIELELPDWVDEKHIYIMAGLEMVAYKHIKQPMKIKVSRCSMCGKCCEDLNNQSDFPPVIDGRCVYLKKDGDKKVCSLGVSRPLSCCFANLRETKGCTEKYD